PSWSYDGGGLRVGWAPLSWTLDGEAILLTLINGSDYSRYQLRLDGPTDLERLIPAVTSIDAVLSADGVYMAYPDSSSNGGAIRVDTRTTRRSVIVSDDSDCASPTFDNTGSASVDVLYFVCNS